jgi:DNA-binding transcriptional ArsR family regulator
MTDEHAGDIADAATMKALAHPLRWSLIEVLAAEGSATAARCAQLLDESQASCSFHLRQLARFGLVEEAPSESRRERPWRLLSVRQAWSTEPTGEPARDAAARTLNAVFVDRETERLRRWARAAQSAPAQWRRAASMTGVLSWLTPDELAEFGEAFRGITEKYVQRIEDPAKRPAGALPVRMFGVGYPILDGPR